MAKDELTPEVLKRYADTPEHPGMGIRAIATELEVSPRRIQNILDSEKVPRRSVGRPKITEETWQERRKAAAKCRTWTDVAKALKLEPWQVNPNVWAQHGVQLKAP